MNDEFRRIVIETLQRGEDLPREWARELFPPERREYELVYYGKEREEDIIADTLAVPLQPVSTFGSKRLLDGTGTNGDWQNKLVFGDNLQALRTLLTMKESGELVNADGTPGVRLVYIDPPFATKQEFRGSQDQKAYQDKVAGAQFVEFLRKRLVLLLRLLSDDGSIYMHLDYRKVHYAKVVLDEIFGEQNLVNEIVWQRTASHNDPGRYGCVHDTILFYRKGSTFIWNEPKMDQSRDYIERFFVYAESPDKQQSVVLKKGEEAPPGWERYALGNLASPHPRPNLTYFYKGYEPPEYGWKVTPERMAELDQLGLLHLPGNKSGRIRSKQYLKDTVGNKAVSDVWVGISPLQGQSLEKQNYPTQKPEALLERIVIASSNPGDIVLDAFAGSGTTLAVAEKLDRRWIGIDCGKLAIYTIQKRMLNLRTEIGNKGKPLSPRPFTLYNAGLYDFSNLRLLSWTNWRFFALQLFGCKDEPHTIGGIHLDGKLRGHSVLVFNHHAQPGVQIDEDTVREIHAALGNKIGKRFFIVAPRGAFAFQEDYLDFEGVRYYALRIPYSVINELHSREFTALRQPSDETDVNNTVDAIGFDFIQPPQVAWSMSVKKRKGQLIDEACLKIKAFESRARIRGKDQLGSFETLSMLMLDFDYNGEVFDFDQVFYAHQLQADEWQAWFPLEPLKERMMVVFVDIYGNEAREVVAREKFAEQPAVKVPTKKVKN